MTSLLKPTHFMSDRNIYNSSIDVWKNTRFRIKLGQHFELEK